MTCRIDAELEANAPYTNGLPTTITAFGHASRDCTRVHVVVRRGPTGGPTPAATPPPIVVFDGVVDTTYQTLVPGTNPADAQNDGLWRAVFTAPAGFPCGLKLWVDASCVSGGGTCEVHGWLPLACKNYPGQPGTGDGSNGNGHGNNGGNGQWQWPWPWPPPIACPRFGRTFLLLLLLGLVAVAWGVCLQSVAVITAGAGALTAAAGVYWVWQHWCFPNTCIFWGAVLWGFKRAAFAALVLALSYLSLAGWLVMIGYGIVGGWLVLFLRRRHCPIPSGRTPMSHLPLF